MDIIFELFSDDVEELEFEELPAAGVEEDCKRLDMNE
jgi:hypothetical protein